jgi:hypothetical protein
MREMTAFRTLLCQFITELKIIINCIPFSVPQGKRLWVGGGQLDATLIYPERLNSVDSLCLDFPWNYILRSDYLARDRGTGSCA